MHRALALTAAVALAACTSPPLRGGPHHPRWQAVGGGPAAGRVIVGGRFDPTGRVDGYFQGDRRISLDEFLRITDHADVADTMASRARIRPVVMIAGAAIAVAGLTYGLTAGHCTGLLPEDFGPCNADLQDRHARSGLIGLAGAAIATIGWLIPRGRPSDQELAHWAAEHNHRHHIPPIPPPVQVTAAAAAGGAGLVVAGVF